MAEVVIEKETAQVVIEGPASSVVVEPVPETTVNVTREEIGLLGLAEQGLRGAPGPPGLGDPGVWEQTVPSPTWTIPHGLGRPAILIDVIDSAGTYAEGDVLTNDIDVLVLYFGGASFSGVAHYI